MRKITSLYIFTFISLISLIGCESTVIKFEHKAKGSDPKSLVGDYKLDITKSDTTYSDTIKIERIAKKNYVVINKKDTLYSGEILKKKNNYFLNELNSTTGYWSINSFAIKEDSIYNFYSAMSGYNYDVVDHFYFWEYEKTKGEGLTTYIIDNDKKDTYNAFHELTNNKSGIYIQKIQKTEEVIKDVFKEDEIQLTETWEIYPNPFISSIKIKQNKPDISYMQITNTSGEILQEMVLEEKISTIDLSGLTKGIYLVRLRNKDSKLTTMKIVKK